MDDEAYMEALERRFPEIKNSTNKQAARDLIHLYRDMDPELFAVVEAAFDLGVELGWTTQECMGWAEAEWTRRHL